jgi:hypothetical protein
VFGFAATGHYLFQSHVVHLLQPSATEEFAADLVVDASGRSSKAADWLATLGYPRTTEVTIDALLGYASRRYRISADFTADWRMLVLPAAPPSTRGGVIFPIEDGQWQVTLGGYARDYSPTDEPGFIQFAKGLDSPPLHQAICDAEPLSEIHGWRQTANQWRQFERLGRWPEGFVVVGDSVRVFNPVYGQGMTVAAITAVALDQPSPTTGTATAATWPDSHAGSSGWWPAMALTPGSFSPARNSASRPPRGRGRAGWAGSSTVAVANGNQDVQGAFLRVIHLLDRPAALFHPRVLLPVLAGRRPDPLDGPTNRQQLAFGRPRPGSAGRDTETSNRTQAVQHPLE